MNKIYPTLIAVSFLLVVSPLWAAPEAMDVPQTSPVRVTAPTTLQAVVSDLTVMHGQTSVRLTKLMALHNTLSVAVKNLDQTPENANIGILLDDLGAQISGLQGNLDGVVAMCPATPRMLKVVISQCDSRPFSGKVSSGLLALSQNKAVDAIEAHYRPGEKEPYKAKRLRIEPDGVAYPMEWIHNRGCVHFLSVNPLTDAELMTLLNPGESMEQVNVGDVGLEVVGPHNTRAVFRIYKK